MQFLHRFAGSIQRYSDKLSDPDRYRPDHCPQCEAHRPLRAHGFYTRTLVDIAFDGMIRVRRYLCCCCKRTVSLLPELALPYLRFGVVAIALFLVARTLLGLTLKVSAEAAKLVSGDALPAGAVLGAPFPATGGEVMRRSGGAHRSTCGAGFYFQGSPDVRGSRLDRFPSVPVCRPPRPPARLAGVSRSRRSHRRAASGGAVRLSLNT